MWEDYDRATNYCQKLARKLLLCRLRDLCRDYYGGPWASQWEFVVWREINAPYADDCAIPKEAAEELLQLFSTAEGWWMWKDHEPVFVDADQWRACLREWIPCDHSLIPLNAASFHDATP